MRRGLDTTRVVSVSRTDQALPDGVLDPDAGTSTSSVKRAKHRDPNEHDDLEQERANQRQLDGMVASDTRYTAAQRRKGMSGPVNETAPVGHPRMRRELPEPAQTRRPLSSRQRKARSKLKRQALGRMSGTEHRALSELVGGDRWRDVNDSLTEVVGDIHRLPDTDAARIRRIDRAITRYEQDNPRGHVVYTNVAMPFWINSSNIEGYARNNFPEGRRISFDKYTGGSHTMHEAELPERLQERSVVFELQTRRGIYLGGSDGVDDTSHLLPRSSQYEVIGTSTVSYERPDGTTGSRVVVQLIDSQEKS